MDFRVLGPPFGVPLGSVVFRGAFLPIFRFHRPNFPRLPTIFPSLFRLIANERCGGFDTRRIGWLARKGTWIDAKRTAKRHGTPRNTTDPTGWLIGGHNALKSTYFWPFLPIGSSRPPLSSPMRPVTGVAAVSKRSILVGRVVELGEDAWEFAESTNGRIAYADITPSGPIILAVFPIPS